MITPLSGAASAPTSNPSPTCSSSARPPAPKKPCAACRSGKPDVVVLDLLMPGGMDGIEATRLIRALPEPPQVIILTAYTDDARVVAALRNGALGYIRKDARPEHLLQAVRTAARGELLPGS